MCCATAMGCISIDAGFLGGKQLLRRALVKRGWAGLPIKGILVTHGHLDHVANVAALAKEHHAWVAAPRLDELHYIGKYPYRGVARLCGLLEAAGRVVCGYRPFRVDRWLEDGDEIDVWHGLRVVALPGHTVGHVGFYCARLKLLFCADLFASYRRMAHLLRLRFSIAFRMRFCRVCARRWHWIWKACCRIMGIGPSPPCIWRGCARC